MIQILEWAGKNVKIAIIIIFHLIKNVKQRYVSYKNKHLIELLEMRIIISEMKNTPVEENGRLGIEEEKISEFEDKLIEMVQNEIKDKKMNKMI